MADKRQPRLRDEVSASLEGLDDLAAELADETPVEARSTPALESGASLEELDPDIEASLAEVRELADELAAPAEAPSTAAADTVEMAEQGPTRHMSVEATTTVDDAAAIATADPVEIDFAAEVAEDGGPTVKPVAEISDAHGTAESPVEFTFAPADAITDDGADTPPEMAPETRESEFQGTSRPLEPQEHLEAAPIDDDRSEDSSGASEEQRPTVAADDGHPPLFETGDAETVTAPVLEVEAQPEQITAAVMPAANTAEVAPTRPWSPAAAMEPVPPLAPPPSRPLVAIPDLPRPKLPADGGKKMNILPIVMISIFILVVIALVVVLIRA